MLHLRQLLRLLCTCLLLTVAPVFAGTPSTIPVPEASRLGQLQLELEGSLGQQGVFILQEGAPRITMTLQGFSGTHSVTVSYTVSDHRGHTLMSEQVRSRTPHNPITLELSTLGPGWYRFAYTLSDTWGRSAYNGARDFVVLKGRPRPSPSSVQLYNPFGVRNDRLPAQEASVLRHIGAGWIMDAATPTWAEVQFHSGGSLVWRAKSEARQNAVSEGLLTTGSIGAVPNWVASEGDGLEPYLSDFLSFVRSSVQHAPSPYVSSQLFRTVLPEVAQITQAKMATAGLSSVDDYTSRQVVEIDADADLIELLSHGIQYHADALLVRLPRLTVPPEQYDWRSLKRLHTEWNTNGGRAALWTVTPNPPAFGSTGSGTTPTGTPPSEPGKASDGVLQAQWLVRSHVLQLAHGVERIFADPFSTGPSEYRLFSGGAGAYPDTPQRPRPALAAYAVMTEQLTGATYLGRLTMPWEIWAFAFAKEGRVMLVVWTSRSGATLELNNIAVDSVQVTDMMGRVSNVTVDRGRLVLGLDGSPQYIDGLDAGVLAQVLIDHFEDRVRDLASLYVPQGDVTLPQIADLLYGLATEIWLHQFVGGEGDKVAQLWYRAVGAMVSLAEELVRSAEAGERAAQTALYEVLDWLAVMGEAGAILDVVTDAPSEQAAQVEGSTALLDEAGEAIRLFQADGAYTPHAERMLSKVDAWRYHTLAAPLNVRAAWAIVAREAASLAVMRGQGEEPVSHQLFAQAESTLVRRPYAGFRPFKPYEVVRNVWHHTERARRDVLAQPGLGWLRRSKAEEPDATQHPMDGWDRLTLPVAVVNVSGADADALLSLEAPDDWFWHIDGRIEVPRPDVPTSISVPGTPESGVATMLDIALLIPYDAVQGEYEVKVTLSSAAGFSDQLIFTIQVEEEPALPASPWRLRDTLSIGVTGGNQSHLLP